MKKIDDEAKKKDVFLRVALPIVGIQELTFDEVYSIVTIELKRRLRDQLV